MTSATPRNWPAGLPYLTRPSHSIHLTPDQQATLSRRLEGETRVPASQTTSPSSLVRVVTITDRHHPACGQNGLFSNRSLGPGAFILLYLGKVHGGQSDNPDDSPESDYDLWLDREAGVAVDASAAGNEARFINDYRGIAERPNAEFREVWSEKFQQRCMAVFVLPETTANSKLRSRRRGIAKGQEILISYGKGFWSHRSNLEGN